MNCANASGFRDGSQYMYYENRLKTFNTWPKQIVPTKFALAKCGFFYEGYTDEVKCFACNVRIKDWERTDEPWQEHQKWSPACEYIKMVGWNTQEDVPNNSTLFKGPSSTDDVIPPRTDSHLFVKRW